MVTVIVNNAPSTILSPSTSTKTILTSINRSHSISPNSLLLQQRSVSINSSLKNNNSIQPQIVSNTNSNTVSSSSSSSASTTGVVRTIRRIVSNRTSTAAGSLSSSMESSTATTTPSTTTSSSSSINNNDDDRTSFQSMVVEDSSNLGISSKSSKLKSFYAEHCMYLPAMLGWFASSAALSSYNKIVFGSGHQAFPCPLLLTSVHFLSQWIFSYVVSTLFPISCGTDRLKSPNMTWKEWFSISVPCGLVTSGDVGLSNLSLVTISMTFYTMVKSSAPIFVLMWAYLFGIERITMNLIFVVIIICIGEVLTVAGEVDFHLGGFLLCLSASVLSGARWTLVQLKIRSMDPPLKTTIATMRLLAPSMFWSMLFVSLAIEQPWDRLKDRTINAILYDLFGIGLLGAAFAIFMILCEFWLIMRTNAFVLMIGGVLKELITIFVGVGVFGDELNRVNISGCFVVFVGVLYYKFTHNSDAKENAKNEALAPTNSSTMTDTGNASTRSDRNGYQRSRIDENDDIDDNSNIDINDRISLHNNNSSHDADTEDTVLRDDRDVLGDKTSTASRTSALRSRSGGLSGFFSFGTNSNTSYTKVVNDSSERDAIVGNNNNNTTTTSSRINNTSIVNRRTHTSNNTPTSTTSSSSTVSRGLEAGESTSESASSELYRSNGIGNTVNNSTTGQSSSIGNDRKTFHGNDLC